MKQKLILSEQAVVAIEHVSEEYDRKEAGLGDRFKLSVKEMLSRIQEHPELFQETGKYQRRAVLDSSFPYSIHYFIDEQTQNISIARIFHQHKNPER